MKHLRTLSAVFILKVFQLTTLQAQEFNWVVSVGQEAVNEGKCIAMDSNNDIVHVGIYWGSPDFDPGANEYRLTSAGETDIFIQKLDAGSNLLWAYRLGGINREEVTAMAIDSDNNIYLAGMYTGKTNLSTNNDILANFESIGGYDIFLVKLNSKGDTEWFKTFPGDRDDYITSIVLDDVNNPTIAGSFGKTIDFNPDPFEETLVTSKGSNDAFILKLSRSGNRLWFKTFGSTSRDEVTALAIDTENNIIAGGNFRGTVDFADNKPGSTLISAGYEDSFILKIDTRANFTWVKHISSAAGSTAIWAIDKDSFGNIYTNVEFFTTLDLDKNGNGYVIEPNEVGYSDFALAQYKADGSFTWGKHFINQFDYIEPQGVKISKNGEIFLAGQFRGTIDCDPGPGKTVLNSYSDDTDIFLIKLSQSGSLVWAGQAGGTGEERCVALNLGDDKQILLSGFFQKSADMNPNPGLSHLVSSVSNYDAYAMMITDQNTTSSFLPRAKNNITFYPNPVTDFASMKLPENVSYIRGRITRPDGIVIHSFVAGQKENLELNFSDLLPGIYFIHFDSKEAIQPVKVIKR